jgi:hypothetical protein
MLENPLYEKETPKFVRENLEKYLSKDWTYFGNEQYYEGSLTVFFEALGNYSFLISRGFFIYKKQLLDYQAALQKEYHELVRS